MLSLHALPFTLALLELCSVKTPSKPGRILLILGIVSGWLILDQTFIGIDGLILASAGFQGGFVGYQMIIPGLLCCQMYAAADND